MNTSDRARLRREIAAGKEAVDDADALSLIDYADALEEGLSAAGAALDAAAAAMTYREVEEHVGTAREKLAAVLRKVKAA